MKAFKCPHCDSKLIVELYYHKVNNYTAKFEFEENTEHLDEPTEIDHEEDYDYYTIESIVLNCLNCDYEHVIQVGSSYDTIYAMFADAEAIIGEELSKMITFNQDM